MRDAMPDPRLTTSRPAASTRDADGQCRGIGPSAASTGAPGMGRGRGTRSSVPADAPVARSVVRGADGLAVPRAAPDAVSEHAGESASQAWPLPAACSVEPSDELIRLLDRLQTAVARYVADSRRAGAPLARVLPEVRGLVREAVVREGWYDPGETLMEQVVGWAVAAYYAEPTPSPEASEGAHADGRR